MNQRHRLPIATGNASGKKPDNHRPMAWVLVQKYGVLGALQLLWTDVVWDFIHRVDTAKPVSNSVLFNADDAKEQNRYVASTFRAVHSALTHLQPTVNFTEANFVDIGSGKGKALIAACRFPFHTVTGYEVSEVLHEIANSNLNTLGLQHRASSRLLNAAHIDIQEADLVFYLFNPFTGHTLNQCLQRIAEASGTKKRYVIYVNPTEDAVYRQYFTLIGEQVFQPGDVEVNFYETRPG